MEQFTNNNLEQQLYNRLKQIENDEDWLTAQMHSLCTEDRQREMLNILDEKHLDNFVDVQMEIINVERRNDPICYSLINRNNLETDLEIHLYDKLVNIYDEKWWLGLIFDRLITEKLQLLLLDYLNEGNNDWGDIWEFVSDNVIDWYHGVLQ